MATPDSTSPTLFDSEDVELKSTNSDEIKSEEDKSEEDKSEEDTSGDLKAEDVKPGEDEGRDQRMIALSEGPSLPVPIAFTSPHWRSTLEALLRFPGMKPNATLFRHGNPIAEIAFALGVTDRAYTITESNWVTIAERVLEIQTCCVMQARHVDFDIAADGWITPNITDEWYARVLQHLQGRGFSTTCTAMVPFVVRVYLQKRSWVRFQGVRGRQRHKKLMDALKTMGPASDASAKMVTSCSKVADGFTSDVRAIRKRRLEQAKDMGE
jgi:hypothetical protein